MTMQLNESTLISFGFDDSALDYLIANVANLQLVTPERAPQFHIYLDDLLERFKQSQRQTNKPYIFVQQSNEDRRMLLPGQTQAIVYTTTFLEKRLDQGEVTPILKACLASDLAVLRLRSENRLKALAQAIPVLAIGVIVWLVSDNETLLENSFETLGVVVGSTAALGGHAAVQRGQQFQNDVITVEVIQNKETLQEYLESLPKQGRSALASLFSINPDLRARIEHLRTLEANSSEQKQFISYMIYDIQQQIEQLLSTWNPKELPRSVFQQCLKLIDAIADPYGINALASTVPDELRQQVGSDTYERAAEVYRIARRNANRNSYMQAASGIFGLGTNLVVDFVAILLYRDMWNEIRRIYGKGRITRIAAISYLRPNIRFLIEDIIFDKALGSIPVAGAPFNYVCAKALTWRLAAWFGALSAMGEEVSDDAVNQSLLRLVRTLFPVNSVTDIGKTLTFQFAEPDEALFVQGIINFEGLAEPEVQRRIDDELRFTLSES